MERIDIISKELINALENRTISIIEVLNSIDKLVLTDIDLAEKLIKEIKKNTDLSGNIMVNYISNKIKEKRIYNDMSDETKKIYELYLKNGIYALARRDYSLALETFSEGLELTKHPIFKYYMGKSAFFQGELEQSSKYLHEYISSGSEKFSEANLYLWTSAKKRGRVRERVYRMAILYHTPKIFDSEKAYNGILNSLSNEPNRERVLPYYFNIIKNVDTENLSENDTLTNEEKTNKVKRRTKKCIYVK